MSATITHLPRPKRRGGRRRVLTASAQVIAFPAKKKREPRVPRFANPVDEAHRLDLLFLADVPDCAGRRALAEFVAVLAASRRAWGDSR